MFEKLGHPAVRPRSDEAAGRTLIRLAPWARFGFAGAALTGFGYSLVYPSLGLEGVRRAPPEAQGLAIGVYTAFLGVALGFLIRALGLIAAFAGLSSAVMIGAAIALCAAPIAGQLLPAAKQGSRS